MADARLAEVRRCASCGADRVVVVKVIRHSVNYIPYGRSYQHRCLSCGLEFVSESIGSTALYLVFGTGALAGGLVALLSAVGNGATGRGIGWLYAFLAVVGLVACGAALASLRRLRRNPVVGTRQPG